MKNGIKDRRFQKKYYICVRMINFESVNVALPEWDDARMKLWLEAVAASHGFRVGALNYLFCDDEYILDANRKFINHDYYTDVITFDYTHGDRISGDILISLDTVASNAESIGAEYSDELRRVVVHGVLHLCGINDKGPGEREIMEREEDKALSLYHDMTDLPK